MAISALSIFSQLPSPFDSLMSSRLCLISAFQGIIADLSQLWTHFLRIPALKEMKVNFL